jgi:hypothetical protein
MNYIKNTRFLRQAIRGGQREFKLCLSGGLYSRKTITVERNGRFRVANHIDDIVQLLTGRQLYTESNIGRGMRAGAFSAME